MSIHVMMTGEWIIVFSRTELGRVLMQETEVFPDIHLSKHSGKFISKAIAVNSAFGES